MHGVWGSAAVEVGNSWAWCHECSYISRVDGSEVHGIKKSLSAPLL